jgi:hypothetical protein
MSMFMPGTAKLKKRDVRTGMTVVVVVVVVTVVLLGLSSETQILLVLPL